MTDKGEVKLVESYKKSHYWKHHYSSFLVFKNNLLFGVGNKNYRKVCHEFSDETKPKNLIYSVGLDALKKTFSLKNQLIKDKRNNLLRILNIRV